MNRTREAGQFIEAQRHALAEAVVARQYEQQPELRERYGEAGQAKCVQDTEYHFSCLAAAVTFSSPALFTEYIAWAKTVLAAFGVGPEDVGRNLVCLRDVLNESLPGGMAGTVVPYVDAALNALPAAPTALPSFLEGEEPLAVLARQYLQALLRAERHEAGRLVLDAVRDGAVLVDVYLRVFQAAQREVGRLWQTKQITVAQEHYCTAAAQVAMSQLFPYIVSRPGKGRRLVAASVSGELHEVGLRIVTDLLEADGWDTVYLGANMPAGSVVQTLDQHRPDLLVISATMVHHLGAVERLVSQVRSSEAGDGVKILVGGHPFNVDPDLWQRVGADGCARDAAEALVEAERLLTLDKPQHRREVDTAARNIIGTTQYGQRPQGEAAVYAELTRLNNELLTAQRELARQNSQLARLNAELTDADRRKNEFLAMLAHELRNPLAPIRTGLELMRLVADDPACVEEARAMMEGQARQLVRLVDDLLDVSRVTSGKVTLRKARVELATVVRSAVDATRPLIQDAGHELTVALPPHPILLDADPARLTQILSNLLTNAARYTPRGGRIRLTAQLQDGEAVVTVRDTGIGIPHDMLERIFEMFTQVDRPQEHAQGGLGIGLMLVRRLAEMHGGSVEARSAGPGRGSEFVVRLPALTEPAVTAQPAGDAGAAAPDGLRILVVDDNKDAARMLGLMLKAIGNDVRTAYDGCEALDVAAEFRPDVVLTDLGMPKLDGYDTARRIREHPWGEGIVLVALTGWGQDQDRQRTREAGFDHHLVKPVELSAVRELLAQVPSRP